jgi:3-polyprenyl-4-hydroxybenzoate decarboxylase
MPPPVGASRSRSAGALVRCETVDLEVPATAEIVIDRRAGERTEKFPPPQCPTPGIETARL